MFYYFSSLIFGLSPFLFSLLLSSLRSFSHGCRLWSFNFRPSTLAILCFLPLALSLGPGAVVYSAQVTLQWDASTDSTVAGYKVCYGTSSGNYPNSIDAGKTTTYTVSNLQDTVTYYLATKAYDASKMESGFSNEVVLSGAPGCTYSLSPTTKSFGSSAGTGSVNVTAGAGCSWTAVSNATTWITITSNGSVTGSGTVNYSVTSNPSSSSRSGTMTIAGNTFTVNQSATTCSYSINPTSQSLTSTAGTGSVSVTAPSGCSWTASSSAAWITITSGSSGSGNGTTNYSVSANSGTTTRTGTLTVAGQTFTLTQSGVACSYSISPTSRSLTSSGGTGSVSVTSPSGCSWTASSSAAWITITSGSSGSGNGTTNYSVSANSGTTTRTGTFTVAGQTFTLTQSGVACSYSISPTSPVLILYRRNGIGQCYFPQRLLLDRFQQCNLDHHNFRGTAAAAMAPPTIRCPPTLEPPPEPVPSLWPGKPSQLPSREWPAVIPSPPPANPSAPRQERDRSVSLPPAAVPGPLPAMQPGSP